VGFTTAGECWPPTWQLKGWLQGTPQVIKAAVCLPSRVIGS
jgi:hypothetical protein